MESAVNTPNGSAALSPAARIVAPYRALERHAQLDLTLFVACYNEEANIAGALDAVQEALDGLYLTYEIVVLDDGSRDRSVEVVKDYQLRNPAAPITLAANCKNQGLAHNFAEAAFVGRGRYYKLVCGDNVEPAETLRQVLEHVGKADIILPYHRRSEGRGWGRRLLSGTYTRLVNLLSGYSLAYYNGCGVFRRADVMRWHSRRSGFGFQAELVVRLLDKGATYVEVPVVARERQAGSASALKLRNWLSVGRTLLEIAFRRRR
jgi:glycosyltransferase involved in cell wall biosynthesis